MTNTKPTVVEVANSIRFPQEVAIRKYFGADVEALFERGDNRWGTRALALALFMSEGDDAQKAFERASDLGMLELAELFEADPEELDSEDPDTEVGKES